MYKFSTNYFQLYKQINSLHTVVCRAPLTPGSSNKQLCEIFIDSEDASCVIVRANKHYKPYGVANEANFEVLCKTLKLEYISPVEEETYVKEDMGLMQFVISKIKGKTSGKI